jgi:recombination protein RecR
MSTIPKPIEEAIEAFSSLPGIGPKTASRLTFYLLGREAPEIERFAKTITSLSRGLKYCSACFNIADADPCAICKAPQRDSGQLLVVEEPLDVLALEKTGYKGKYFVLGGVISPVDGVSPEDLNIKELLTRLEKDKNLKEVILATDPSLEGEATAMYISKSVEQAKKEGQVFQGLKLTRIARGLPVGGDLEYADEVTLTRALEGRREY